jgi:hypothetical protein
MREAERKLTHPYHQDPPRREASKQSALQFLKKDIEK